MSLIFEWETLELGKRSKQGNSVSMCTIEKPSNKIIKKNILVTDVKVFTSMFV